MGIEIKHKAWKLDTQEWRSKIKCIHSGEAPCRNCLKSGRTDPGDCVLSGPVLVPGKKRQRRNEENGQPQGHLSGTVLPTPPNVAGESPEQQSQIDLPTFISPKQTAVSDERCGILDKLSRQDLIRAINTFSRKFPELSFVQLTNIATNSSSPLQGREAIRIAAIMAVCAHFINSGNQAYGPEEYAAFARNGLSSCVLEAPELVTVQSLLIISMYEWGMGNGYGAWMYSGMATRMMQSLSVMKRGPDKNNEVQNRTFWACFIMDRLVFCGESQPFTLPLESMSIHLPVGEQDFAFGGSRDLERLSSQTDARLDTIDNSYCILVKGFNIWAKILKMIISGGRRQPEMSQPHNCPWVSGSPWNNLLEELQNWRRSQSERMQYPTTDVAMHVSLGHGEVFCYVNLIYYISILFLHREYIPFLPTLESEPKGPVDPPLLQAVAPDGWWANNSGELFQAAANITEMISKLDEVDASLLTPFAGFCVFSAATMNIYISNFPRMNLCRSINTRKYVEMNIEYLKHFKGVWKMGKGWSKTIDHTVKLYQGAVSDRARFYGKTRADFTALEASMHDYAGVSPVNNEATSHDTSPHLRPQAQASTDHEAAVSLQELFHAHSRNPEAADLGPDEIHAYEMWNDIWPTWGEQQFIPYAVGGIPFDYNLDLSSL